MTTGFEIVVLLLCLAAAWFFSGIETGLISINRLRLRHLVRRKVPGADTLDFFLRNPDALLGTTLVGTNIAHTVAAVLAVSLGAHAFGARGVLIADVVITLVMLAFCEYFPKAWFQSCPAPRVLPFAPLLRFSRLLLLPISIPLMYLVRALVPVRRGEQQKVQPFVTREEIVHLASEGKASGILTPAEHQMIHEVIQLKTKTCREIMTPRDKMVWAPLDASIATLLETARARDVDRVPVYDKDRKTFPGVVNMFDVLSDTDSAAKNLTDYMRPPQFVADHTPVDHVLPRMRVTRQPMVMVVDERFEVIGLVTLHDVLEEVLGSL
jgi:putative hemolysin